MSIRDLAKFVLAAALLGIAPAFPAAVAAAEQKVALVIGNAAYPSAALRNPVNDANAIAAKLKALGFEVILKTDANLRDMTRSFSQFGQKLVPGTVSLFYYAGHGMQVRGKNYLIPVDAEIDNEASVRSEAVDVEQILEHLGPSRLSMVILDACRNNPFERRVRGGGSGLAQIDAPPGTLIAYATAPGKVASDGAGSNGLYTSELLKAMDLPGLKVEDAFKAVRVNVMKSSDNEQIPWEASSLTSEFSFRPGSATASASDGRKLEQAEKVQGELQRALLDERRKREREAELIKIEMEKLRAELLKMRAGQTAVTVVAAVPQAAPQSGTGTPQAPAEKTASNPAGPVPQASTQVALAAPPASAAGQAANSAEWAQRIALLDKSRGNLTLSKAVAILLDISNGDDLIALVNHDQFLRQKSWPAAMAMGVGADGGLAWAVAWNWRRVDWANEAALENCVKTGAGTCKVVLRGGELDEAGFFEVSRQLNGQDPQTVRQQYLQSVKTPGKTFNVTVAGSGGVTTNVLAGVTVSR